MTRPVAGLNRVFLYRLTSPVLLIPWVWTQFFASSISWGLIALYSVWNWNSTIFWAPTWTLAAFFVLVPFQESQEPMIRVLELITQNIDDFVNDDLFPIIEDLFYIVQPGCWAYNFLWDGTVTIFRIAIYDPVKQFLRMLIPVDPLAFFKTIPFTATAFPVTTEIDTSNSPDWVVGPYGRIIRGRADDVRYEEHPLLDGSRRIIVHDDPAARALIRWLRRHTPPEDLKTHPHVVQLVIPPDLLDRWTHPSTPAERRRSISEQLLRKYMDRSVELETPSWWELSLAEREKQEQLEDEEEEEAGVDGQSGMQGSGRHAYGSRKRSPWARVFEIPPKGASGMGVVRMDVLPDLVAEYGPERARNIKIPPGSIAYRFLADDKGTRALNFQILQDVAQVFADFFDIIVNVLVELWNIALVVADFLFDNIEDFFTNAFQFVANVFNQIWKEFLNLPCLRFNSVSVFAISLLDCICGPLTQAVENLGGNIRNWFNYSRPRRIEDLPQAILGCVGLGCINITEINSFNAFAQQLFGNCMQLPAEAVCCLIRPTSCFINSVIVLTSCGCDGDLNVQPPECDYPSNSSDDWLKCIVMWFMNNVLEPFGSNSCQITGCPPLSSGGGNVANKFLKCIALSILEVGDFIDELIPLLDDIFGGIFQSVSSGASSGLQSAASAASGVADSLFGSRLPPIDERNKGSYHDQTQYERWIEATHPNPKRELARLRRAREWRERAMFLGSGVSIGNGGGTGGVPGSSRSVAVAAALDRRRERRHQKDLPESSSSSTGPGRSTAIQYRNQTMGASLLEPDNRKAWNKAVASYGHGGAAEILRLQDEAWNQRMQSFYHDLDPSSAELDTFISRGQDDTKRYDQASLMQQLSWAVGSQARSRRRADLQARIDRRLYSNPYIRRAVTRGGEILRDLIDFAEYRIYGPDPFVLPPSDADPEQDPRVYAARYVDETDGHNHAYAFHAEAIKENPYYAGLYKVLFQVGDPDSLGRDVNAGQQQDQAGSYDGGPFGNLTQADSDRIWAAMGMHGENPLFHMGRLMAASRQLLYGYRLILNEVWWDSDSFSFHFPNFEQMHSLMLQSHLPTYMDDFRSAIGGMFRARAAEAHQMLVERAVAYTDDVFQNPEEAAARHGGPAQSYSLMVQAEVAIRTIATRLLSPRHLEPMLDELSTRSPLHARYAHRMKNRVINLEQISDRAHLELEQKIQEWRARSGQTITKRTWTRDPSSGKRVMKTEILNRPLIDLDPTAHPEAGNRTLVIGERVRFEDGKTGIYLGTVGSSAPLNPTRSIQDGSPLSARWQGPQLGFTTRAPQIIAVLKGVVKVIQFLINNWRLIATGFVTVVTSPWGRVFWESWFVFIYNRIIEPLYSEGLRGVFGSLFDILLLVFDFQILNETIWFFLVNELFRYILCFAWIALIVVTIFFPLKAIAGIISFGLLTPVVAILGVGVAVIAIAFPYCPPEQVLEDNRLTVMPYQYLDQLILCFGDPDISDIDIGKNVYNGICSVKTDCIGNAPCICENKGGQYSSAFAAFVDDTPCGTVAAPTGQCLCWPKIDCQFLFPRIGINRLFDVDCSDMYGYRINEITWYQTSAYFKIFYNIYQNFWINLRYLTRLLTLARGINPLLFMLLIAVAFLVLFYANVYAGIGILVVVMGYEYALPLWKALSVNHIIPGLETVKSNSFWPITILANWFIRFLRFPNFTAGSPLGQPRSGEGVCFFFNFASFLGGGAVAFWFWATVLALVWYGLGPTIWFVFNNVMVPIRIAYAPIWLYWQRSRLSRHFKKAKNQIRRSMPSWMKRSGAVVGQQLASIGQNMIPQAPNYRLNRWINKYYPDPTPAWRQRLLGPDPTHVDGSIPGYGAGTLDHEMEQPIRLIPSNSPQQQQQQQQQSEHQLHGRRSVRQRRGQRFERVQLQEATPDMMRQRRETRQSDRDTKEE